MYRDHFSRLSILIVTFMACHYRTNTTTTRKKCKKIQSFLFIFVCMFKLFGSHGERAQFCDKPFSSLLLVLNRAYTNNKKPREEKEHNSYIWWPLHYCLSFCIEQDVKYFICYILHIHTHIGLRLCIQYSYTHIYYTTYKVHCTSYYI